MLRRLFCGLSCYLLATALSSPAGAENSVDRIRQLRSSAVDAQMAGNFEGAIESYERAISLAQKEYGRKSTYVAEIYYDEALALLSNSTNVQYARAEQCLNKALQINPNAVGVRLKLAELLHLKNQTQEARQHAHKVLAKHRDCVQAHQILAMAYQQEGNVAKATQECFFVDAIMHGKIPQQVLAVAAPPVVQPPVREEARETPEESDAAAGIRPKPTSTKSAEKPKPKPKAEPPAKKVEKSKARPAAPKVSPHVVAASAESSARLKSKAVLLTPVKHLKNKSAASTETIELKEDRPKLDPAEAPKSKPMAASADAAVPEATEDKSAEAPALKPKVLAKKPKPKIETARRPKPGLVPPPPPVVPIFPGGMSPILAPPPMQVMKPKPKPVEKKQVVEDSKENKDNKDSHAGPTEEDSDFLLDWAETKKKKAK